MENWISSALYTWRMSSLTKFGPWSEWICSGIPKRQKMLRLRMDATFLEVVSLVGYASSQREKVSLTVRM